MIAHHSSDERRAWLDQLLSLSVADGSAILRDAVRDLTAPEPTIAAYADDGLEQDDEQPDDSSDDEQADDEQLDASQLDDDQALGDEQPDEARLRGERDRAMDPLNASRLASPGADRASAARAVFDSADLPTLDDAALVHFEAIQRVLTLAERMRVHELAAQRPASELRAWIGALAKLPVPEAVARLRAALAASDSARDATNGGVS
jgi:hypothetical protein